MQYNISIQAKNYQSKEEITYFLLQLVKRIEEGYTQGNEWFISEE